MDQQPHNPTPFPPNTHPKGISDSDPHLQALIEEIKTLLQKHQVAGYVAIQSPHYAEYLIELPSWACIKISPDGHVRIYAKHTQFPTREAWVDCVSASTGMVLQFEDMLRTHADQFAIIVKKLGEHFDVAHISKHTPGRYSADGTGFRNPPGL